MWVFCLVHAPAPLSLSSLSLYSPIPDSPPPPSSTTPALSPHATMATASAPWPPGSPTGVRSQPTGSRAICVALYVLKELAAVRDHGHSVRWQARRASTRRQNRLPCHLRLRTPSHPDVRRPSALLRGSDDAQGHTATGTLAAAPHLSKADLDPRRVPRLQGRPRARSRFDFSSSTVRGRSGR